MKPTRAKLFQNGGSQAVRLPKDCRFESQGEVSVRREDLNAQRDFAQRVAASETLMMLQRDSLSELDALFASLQHRAFRGEL